MLNNNNTGNAIIEEGARPNFSGGVHNTTIRGNPTLNNYHEEEIHTHKIITYNLIGMAWVGIAIVLFGVGLLVWRENITTGIITVSAGAILDLIDGTIVAFAKFERKDKNDYYKNLSMSDYREQVIAFVNSIEDGETKMECQKELAQCFTNNLK